MVRLTFTDTDKQALGHDRYYWLPTLGFDSKWRYSG